MKEDAQAGAPQGKAAGGALPAGLLFAMVFVEGFASLGAEIVALRRLVPHVGSAITVTAPTIGFFLLALALGYQAGGKVTDAFLTRVRRNFLWSAALIAVGLCGPFVDAAFARLGGPLLAYMLVIGAILCPVAYLLGQTVPVLTNLLRHEHVGARSGAALFWSTLGSFLGSLSLSMLVMQWLGVFAAILVCVVCLLAVVWCLPAGDGGRVEARGMALAIAALALLCNVWLPQQVETAYATYRVEQVTLSDRTAPRVFWVNNSLASLIDASEPPRFARYIERLRDILIGEMALKARDILVLGAGGFTLSHDEKANRYTYVDIDPAIRELAEQHFLRNEIQGRFVAMDARRFVIDTPARFDVVVVDAYSAHTSMPAHLVTREFWGDVRRVLKPGGTVFINLLLDSRLETPLARNMLATIQSVYGPCGVEILFRERPLSNVLVQCFDGAVDDGAVLYVDERNRADLDLMRSR